MNDECDRRVEVGVTQWALINVIPSILSGAAKRRSRRTRGLSGIAAEMPRFARHDNPQLRESYGEFVSRLIRPAATA